MRLLLAIVLLAFAAAPARAGTYEHVSLPGHDGWSPEWWTPLGFVSAGLEGDAAWAGFFVRASFTPGERAEWSYAAPPGTTITGWSFEREVSGIGGGDWNTLFSAEADGRSRLVAFDVPSANRGWELLGAGDLAATRLVARLVCGGPGPCHRSGPAAILRVRRARVWLHDGAGPSVSGVQGELVAEPVLAGAAHLAFSASDAGGGVYRVLTVVDGSLRAAAVVDEDGGRCRPMGNPYRFALRVPCPRAASGRVALDTTALADGRHSVEVIVEDAAGNRTTVYGPATKTVRNQPPPPPPPAPLAPAPPAAPPSPEPRITIVDAWLGRHARAVTIARREPVLLRGHVIDQHGRPVAGVRLTIRSRVIDGHGRPVAALPTPPVIVARTGHDGTFEALVRPAHSRRLRVEGGPALTVRVRAPVTARAGGGRVRGRVRGYVPRGGAYVEIRVGRRTRIARTSPTGRYWARVPPGRAIRVRVPRQAGLPYAAGLARALSPPRTGRR